MIAATLIALAAATPIQSLEQSSENYVECLRRNAGQGPFERQVAVERTRLAMARCRDRREALISWAIDLLTRQGADQPRERAERGVAMLETVFPATLIEVSEGPIRIVPEMRCASELEVRNGCLD